MTAFEAAEGIGVRREDVRELSIDGSPETVFEFTVAESDQFAVWKQLRAVVDDTQRWPLAFCHFSDIEDATSRFAWVGPHGLDVSPGEIIRRAPELDIDSVLQSHRINREQWFPDDEHLEGYLRGIEGFPDLKLQDLRSAIGPKPTMVEVDRWVLDQQQLAGFSVGPDPDAWYLEWPSFGESASHHMLLLPVSQSWQTAAYVGGYGWGHPHPDVHTAVLRRWQHRYGAELVANATTSLNLVVDRPPQTIDEAWVVAEEVNLLWPDTAGGRNGVDTRTHAQDLVGRDTWFVISDP